MDMGMGPRMEIRLTPVISLRQEVWSLLKAFHGQGAGPPPYIPPTFEEEAFVPRLRVERKMIKDFEQLGHPERMRLVEETNSVFRFDYGTREDKRSGKITCIKVPLVRNYNVDSDKIKITITKAEYDAATAFLDAVGQVERIARSIPYHQLYVEVASFLRDKLGVGLEDTVLVSVDRGGRLPCIILMNALGLRAMRSLKVDQGGAGLDMEALERFTAEGAFRGKHVLFVDSTVDSGRQINVLAKYFDDSGWKSRLGHRSWHVVGSNEYGKSLQHHQNINWGVDPDETFEDNPELMGIDYADGSRVKVKECPTKTSEEIRACLLSVPAGWIYDAGDINKQVAEQRKQWQSRQKERRAAHRQQVKKERAQHKVKSAEERANQKADRARYREDQKLERQLKRIVSTKKWQSLVAAHKGLPVEALPDSVPNGVEHPMQNVLVVGSGRRDLPEQSAKFVADNLGPHCSFFAGTPDGNPGAVLKAALDSPKVKQPEVRLYQPGEKNYHPDETFGGVPVVFAGPDKADMRRQMIEDSHLVLALGGGEGTLREVLLAIGLGKNIILIQGYGPVANYVLSNKRLRARPGVKTCANLVEAVTTALNAA